MNAVIAVRSPVSDPARLIRGLSDNGIEVLRLELAGALMLKFECLKHRMICYEPLVLPWALPLAGAVIVSTVEQALVAINRRHNVGVPRI